MTRYRVHHARGSLYHRQVEASDAGCVCYAEQHCNSIAGNPDVCYAMVICAANASETSKAWGRRYTELIAREFGIPDRGVIVTSGRGSYNVRIVRCPSILLEPGFISNPEFADAIRSGDGIDGLARCLVTSIVDCFPSGGLIGLSAGHAYRGKADPGAPVYDKGAADIDPKFDDETEINIAVIDTAAEMLVRVGAD